MATENGELSLECGTISVVVERLQKMLEAGSCVAFAKGKFRTPVGSIAIDNFRLVKTSKGGLFVASPSHKKGEKFYDDVVVTEDLHKLLTAAVKKAYQDAS